MLVRKSQLQHRLTQVGIALAGRDDTEARIAPVQNDAVDAIGPRESPCGGELVAHQPLFGGRPWIRPAAVHAARRGLIARRRLQDLQRPGPDLDGPGRVQIFGKRLEADPASGKARHGKAQQSEIDHLRDG